MYYYAINGRTQPRVHVAVGSKLPGHKDSLSQITPMQPVSSDYCLSCLNSFMHKARHSHLMPPWSVRTANVGTIQPPLHPLQQAGLCGEFDLKSYPSIYLGRVGLFAAKKHKELTHFSGPRELPNLVGWVGSSFNT